MINIEACKKILNNENHQYTDNEIMQIRGFLYQLAQLQIIKTNKEFDYE